MSPRQARRSTAQVREAIVREATKLFIERGYAGASMNELNARVGGSKVTLYKQFGNKKALFSAVLDHVLEDHMVQLEKADFDAVELHEGLEAIARLTLSTVSSPEAIGLWRLLYVEAPNSPELARLFISRGPARTFAGVERFLAGQVKRKALKCRDPAAAAEYFVGMLLHKPMLLRYCERIKPLSKRRLNEISKRVTTDFLRMCESL